MKETTTEEVPATTIKRTVTICDACGAKTEPGENWPADPDWGREAEDVVTVSSVRTIQGYEADGSEDGLAWDFCPPCFDQKVRPLLETIAKARKVEDSW